MPPSRAPSWRVLIAAVCCVARVAWAQTDASEVAVQELPAVEIAVHSSPRAPAAQSTVLETARFAGEGRTVAELLSTAPGVALHASGGPGQPVSLSLRGASPEQSLVLLDGIPLQGPGGGSVDLSLVPSTLLDRAVVSRGVLGAQLGAGALGGALELVPKAAGAEKLEGGVQASLGSFGTAQLAGDVSGRTGATGWTAALQLDRTSGDFDYTRKLTPELQDAPWYLETRENADARRGSLLLRTATQLGAAELDVLVQGGAGERGLPGPVGAFTTRSRAQDQGGVAGVRLKGLAGDVFWSAQGWARGQRVLLSGVQDVGFGDCAPGTYGCAPIESHALAARGEGEVAASLPGAQWLTARLSAGEDWVAGSASGVHRRAVASLAVSDDVKLLHGALAFHPAVRVDQVAGDTWLSPGVGVSVRPLADQERLELRGGVGASVRPPGFSELYLDQGAVAPNPALRPEHALSADVGATLHAGALRFTASAFWSRYEDLIVYELFPPARIKPFNIGAARIAGGELQAVAVLPLGFTAEVAYSLLDAVNQRPSATEGGRKLAYRPPHRLFVRGARRGDRLEGFAEAVWTASMPRNNFGTAFLPAQLVVNAGAGARVAGPLWLDVEVRNALNDQTLQDLFQYPLPGISVTALARARF